MNKTNAEIMDIVLQFLLDNNGGYAVETIFDKLDKPANSISHFHDIVKEMKDTGGKFFNYRPTEMYIFLNSNDFTQEFLDEGGFMANYHKEQQKVLEEKEKVVHANKTEQIKLNKIQTEGEIAKRNLKYYWTPHWISGISAIIAISSLLFSFYKTSDNVSQEELDTKIESVEGQLEQLRNDFKKENDLLKDRLYKAEMLIAVYESEPN